jgi:hypothetical protein
VELALAAWPKRDRSFTNRWLAEAFHIGAPDAVSRYVGEVGRGARKEAARVLADLTTRVRG